MDNSPSGFNISSSEEILSPQSLISSLPLGERQRVFIQETRDQIKAILKSQDPRHLVIVGPCSIHDVDAALDYARRLKALSLEFSDKLLIIMRCYFEKPRTEGGWKGLVNDPLMDGSYNIPLGLKTTRSFLLELADLELPAGSEALDPLSLLYYEDLISWTCIGARTSESQTHRNLASMLKTPVGFKNPTSGDLEVAVHALVAASNCTGFLSVGLDGRISSIRTEGNDCCHLILRGTSSLANYHQSDVQRAISLLKRCGLNSSILIDCSHGNSGKHPAKQKEVLSEVLWQISRGEDSIRGFMLESFLFEGSQCPGKNMKYGVSVTDPCLSWDETEIVLRNAYEAL